MYMYCGKLCAELSVNPWAVFRVLLFRTINILVVVSKCEVSLVRRVTERRIDRVLKKINLAIFFCCFLFFFNNKIYFKKKILTRSFSVDYSRSREVLSSCRVKP